MRSYRAEPLFDFFTGFVTGAALVMLIFVTWLR